MAKRRVIHGANRSIKTRFLQFGASFTSWGRFKRYWLSRDGARRVGMTIGAGILVILAVFAYFAKDLPSPSKINERIGAENTVFYDRTGKIQIYEVHGDQNRTVIDFNAMPQSLKDATIAIEDRDFYKEGAFSSLGILRAVFVDITDHGTYEGGSTITQQYVKNALLDPTDHTFTRKIKELILSLEINQLYKKDDVLKLYLNEIPYGSEAYGVEAACRTFFPKDQGGAPTCTQNLTLGQSATLAAMENLPTYYSPYGDNISDLQYRQNLVLDDMVKQKMITESQANAAKLTSGTSSTSQLVAQLNLNPTPNVETALSPYPQFAIYADEFLEDQLGANTVENGGLKVITTLNVTDQNLMQQTVSDDPEGIKAVRASHGSNVAMVTGDPKTGQVLAMLGSYNPDVSPFNVALADRQPGSSFKPFVYSQLMKGNWGAGSTVYDVVTNFGSASDPYIPTNYANPGQSSKSYGVQSVRTALDGSLNVPAVKALYIAGIQNSINNAHAMGITTLNDPASSYGLSLVLGAGGVKLNDMVNAYETFANGGYHYPATPILKVTDPHNHVLIDNSKPKTTRVLDPQIAYILDNILSDNQARAFIFGLNSPLHIAGRTAAAKTGTTTDFRDAWTMGYTPDLVTGVWVGNNDNTPMTNEAVDIAAPIWHDYMAGFYDPVTKKQVTGALSTYPTTDAWTAPPGIQTLTLDADTGAAVTSSTRLKRTDIFPSWYKLQNASGIRTAQIDKVSGLLATTCTPPAAIETVTAGEIHAEIPSTDPEYSNWEGPVAALARSLGYSAGGSAIPTASDNVHSCSDTKPAVSVTATGSGPIQITATVTSGTFPANLLTIYYDDQVISTQTISGSTTYTMSYTPTAAGSHTVKAEVSDTGLYTADDETTVTIAATTPGGTTPGGTTPTPPTTPAPGI